jgi:hypothetical protein
MEDSERARIEALATGNPELRTLWEEHVAFEQRLLKFDGHSHLTPGEEFERKRIQKLKLAGKDRIAVILSGGQDLAEKSR